MTTAIVVAVEEEFRAIRKRMPRADLESAGGICFVRGDLGGLPVALAKSGMGAKRAYTATCALIEVVEPVEVVVAGFGAGMRDGIVPGDLIVATEVRSTGNLTAGVPFADAPAELPRDRQDRASRAHLQDVYLHFGCLVTCDQVLRKSVDKHGLSVGPDVVAADMESLGAVAAACGAQRPWLAVRAITDAVDDDLPLDFEQFLDRSGEASRGKIALHVALRPWLAPALVRLGMRSALAARNLAAFVEEYVRLAGTTS